MNSLTDLREVVDVVIGVDTHVHTHSAAVVDAATGGVLGEITVDATAQGYAELVEFANNHPMLRAWAIEGTGGHGAGAHRNGGHGSDLVLPVPAGTVVSTPRGAVLADLVGVGTELVVAEAHPDTASTDHPRW